MARGERLLLTAPMTPLLFMGQEWAATSPFLFFTDHSPDCGHKVTTGRRQEFAEFPEFADEDDRASIPDPQALSTFNASRLNWHEREEAGHAAVLALYQTLIALRRAHPALGAATSTQGEAAAPDDATVIVRRAEGDAVFWIVAKLTGAGTVALADAAREIPALRTSACDVVLTTEDPRFALDPQPLDVRSMSATPVVHFTRPGAVILREAPPGTAETDTRS